MGKKLVYGIGISDNGEFEKTHIDKFGKKRNTKEYCLWHGMMKRCYSNRYHTYRPSYTDCSVSVNFKSFQYFAEWCQGQVGFKTYNYQLDKDLIFKGNKMYSENCCLFVPRIVNLFLTSSKSIRGEHPVGVSLYRGKSFKACVSGTRKCLGYFTTPELAFQAYKTAKEAMAKELAIQYEGLVDPRVIVALNNYVVNIED